MTLGYVYGKYLSLFDSGHSSTNSSGINQQINSSPSYRHDEYSIDEFYKKVDLDVESLDENGDEIEYIFQKTDIKPGKYQIEITDGPGDLYEIKGTDYFIKFRGYYGYAGYADEGILDVGNSSYSSTFYKKE